MILYLLKEIFALIVAFSFVFAGRAVFALLKR